MTEFFRLAKTGRMVHDRKGNYVDRNSYDNVVRENRFLKENLTWKNFNRKFCMLVDEDKELKPEIRLSLMVMFNGLNFLADSSKDIRITKDILKSKQNSPTLKGDEL